MQETEDRRQETAGTTETGVGADPCVCPVDQMGTGEHGQTYHVPVMRDEIIECFNSLDTDSVIVDCTVGAGGHSRALLESGFRGRIIGIDRDPKALTIAQCALSKFQTHVTLYEYNFSRINELLASVGITAVNGFLFDLGVSSMQIDSADRGFAYRKDGPLDMRMGGSPVLPGSSGPTAADLVNTAPEAELERIFREYGEERLAGRIAGRIVRERTAALITTTAALNRIVLSCYGPYGRTLKHHPASRVFQALRIAVNDELGNLKAGLEQAFAGLTNGGLLAVLAYHSLEDRIVKQFIRGKKNGDSRLVSLLKQKAASAEKSTNPRARSVRLRVARKSAAGLT